MNSLCTGLRYHGLEAVLVRALEAGYFNDLQRQLVAEAKDLDLRGRILAQRTTVPQRYEAAARLFLGDSVPAGARVYAEVFTNWLPSFTIWSGMPCDRNVPCGCATDGKHDTQADFPGQVRPGAV